MTEKNIAVPQQQKTDVDKLLRILKVLKTLDHEHGLAQWYPDGRPDSSYISAQLGELITDNSVAEAAPSFRRLRRPTEIVDDIDSAEQSVDVSASADMNPSELSDQCRIAEQLRADSLVEITVLKHKLAQAQSRQQEAVVAFMKNDKTIPTRESLVRQFCASEAWLRQQRAAGVKVDHHEHPDMSNWTVEDRQRYWSTNRGVDACNTASTHQTMSRSSMWGKRAHARIFGGV